VLSIRNSIIPYKIKDADVSPGCCLAKMTTVLVDDVLSLIDEFRLVVDP